MSESNQFSGDKLFHENKESYEIDDIYEYGFDILRQKGDVEVNDLNSGKFIASQWGDRDTRYQCKVFAQSLLDSPPLYLISVDGQARDSVESVKSFRIHAPFDSVDNAPEAHIQVLHNSNEYFHHEEDSGEIKGQIEEMFSESGVQGPSLTSLGRRRFWEGVASMALDNDKGNLEMQAFLQASTEDRLEGVRERWKARIADIALSQMIALDSGSIVPVYDSIPRPFMMRQIESRFDDMRQHRKQQRDDS